MLNPNYQFSKIREVVEEFEPSRERALVLTKLDEAELWLTRCVPTEEALNRDQRAPAPGTELGPSGKILIDNSASDPLPRRRHDRFNE
jgi:hypothetical protein